MPFPMQPTLHAAAARRSSRRARLSAGQDGVVLRAALALLTLALLAGCRPEAAPRTAPSLAPRPETPVTITGPGTGDAALRRCLGGPDGASEMETHAAANPKDPRHLVATWMTHYQGGAIQSSASFDGGRTWTAPHTLPVNGCAGGAREDLTNASDPWAAVGPEGRAYVATQAWIPSDDGPDTAQTMFVFSSADGGRTWQTAGIPFATESPYRFFDNVAIAADPKTPGVAYIASTRYEYPELEDHPARTPFKPKPGQRLRSFGPAAFSATRDGGKTWSEARVVTPLVEGERVSAPQVAIDPVRGLVHVVYYSSNRGKPELALVTSTDGGRTFGAPAHITPFVQVPDHHHPGTKKFVQLAQDILRVAVDAKDGSLYVAYADGAPRDGSTLAVSLVVSRDGGKTFSAPRRISPADAPTAWLPGVAVDALGRVGIAYLAADFRGGERPRLPVTVHLQTFTRQGDALADESQRVLDRYEYTWPGDYLGLVAAEGGFTAVYARSTDPVDPQNPTDVVAR